MRIMFEDETRGLSRVDVLEPLSREELERVAARTYDISLDRDKTLSIVHEDSGKIFLLGEGRLELFMTAPDGPRRLTLAFLDEGTIFGRLIEDYESTREVYARAVRPSLLAVLEQEELEDLIRACPEVGVRLLRLASQRLGLYQSRLVDLAYQDTTGRLASLILYLLEEEGVRTREGYEVPTHYTHKELGEMIGAKRVAVSRAFARLREAGAVAPGRRILVSDLKALNNVARDGS